MKISTAYLFDRATERMSTIQNQLATTQAQLAESKQILSPSDSPDQAAAIQRLKGQIALQDSHAGTLNIATRRYSAEETALSSANDALIRFKELSIQAANDTLGPSDREAVATEMRALKEQLLSLGNTRDDSGNYIFSGTRVNTPAFAQAASGAVRYQGDQTQTRIPAGVERTVAFTRSGSDVFSRVTRGSGSSADSVSFFDALDDAIAAVATSDTKNIQRGIGEVEQMHSNLTLSLAQCGSDRSIVESQLDVISETKLRLKTALSDIEDLDYTEAVTRMNKEQLALQSAMASFAKISGLSLFDYIRG